MFFSVFQEATHELVANSWSGLRRSADVVCRLRYPAGTRLTCHWRSVKVTSRRGNTVSPAEPLLQDAAGPILSAWPLLTVTVHLLECCVATLVVFSVHDRDDLTEIFQDCGCPIDPPSRVVRGHSVALGVHGRDVLTEIYPRFGDRVRLCLVLVDRGPIFLCVLRCVCVWNATGHTLSTII